ncbi:hypothetical protein BC827DRAFT_1386142 [Russula dissimulans]|nr:hypothetical protein BC827DRAFT_1386142 [Russula dissimulans]
MARGTVGDGGEKVGRHGRAARSPLVVGDVERVTGRAYENGKLEWSPQRRSPGGGFDRGFGGTAGLSETAACWPSKGSNGVLGDERVFGTRSVLGPHDSTQFYHNLVETSGDTYIQVSDSHRRTRSARAGITGSLVRAIPTSPGPPVHDRAMWAQAQYREREGPSML